MNRELFVIFESYKNNLLNPQKLSVWQADDLINIIQNVFILISLSNN